MVPYASWGRFEDYKEAKIILEKQQRQLLKLAHKYT